MIVEIRKTNSNRAPIIVLYGGEGRGKTTLASKFPAPLFLLLERGLPRGIEVDAVQNVEDFGGVMNVLREVFKARDDYQALVIDTIDQLEGLIHKQVCAENRWANIESASYGKGYVAADLLWRQFLGAINTIRDARGMTVVLVGHAAIDRVEDPRAPTYTAYGLRLHRRARGLVMDAADIVGFLADDLRITTDDLGFNRERIRAAASPARYLFLEGRPAFAAKNRYGMPDKLEIPKDLNFETLARYFAAEHEPAKGGGRHE